MFSKSVGIFVFLILGLLIESRLFAQAPLPAKNSAEIHHSLQKLQTLGSVMYIAAHPDDENTRLLAYFAGERGYRTAYLSMTRGDGGQNSIGEEVGPHLGILRTQELLAARRIDGAEQMFTRAYDFGYSKTPEETFKIWGKDKILADVVWAIRKFQPDVIITRFPGPEKGGGGHGHHTASAMLAQEAFDKAADPNVFPEQLKYVPVWQPKRLLWNTWMPGQRQDFDYSHTLTLNVDTYNPLLGRGFGEIAAEARSMHKCQDFGVARWRGEILEYLQHEKGEEAKTDVFEGVITSWDRIGETKTGKLIEQIYQDYKPANPAASIPGLLKVWKLLEGKQGYWYEQKRKELQKIIVYCAGIWMEVNSLEPLTAPGDSARLTAQIIKRSEALVELTGIEYGYPGVSLSLNQPLKNDHKLLSFEKRFLIQNLPASQHYWLKETMGKGSFQVSDPLLIGLPETPPALTATWKLKFEEVEIAVELPVIHKYVDRSEGELYRPFIIAPPVTVNIPDAVYLFTGNEEKEIKMTVRSFLPQGNARLKIIVPEGWEVFPAEINIQLEGKGTEQIISTQITPSQNPQNGTLKVVAEVGNFSGSFSTRTIAYDHIPVQMVFDPAETKLVRVNLEKRGDYIGYIMGAEDEVSFGLEQIGYKVDLLEDDKIRTENLRKYDAVIAGNRAYYRRSRMPFHREQILEYVREGGTYIVQYNKNFEIPKGEQPGPYPLSLSRERVTDEDSEIKFLTPDHPILNFPNKITAADFEGWIQERGLYFPGEWDERYTAVLSCQDPGESPQNGSLLVASYGKGYFIYTSLAWFREIPAGVPGAYRLFANMISIGKDSQ
ncbi:MAG: PIG-L family deacetylase [Bacteroidia bacterium]|nr:PIG-L family deacetylase [Bacteroidia bacterium]